MPPDFVDSLDLELLSGNFEFLDRMDIPSLDKARNWHPFTQMKAWCEGDPLVLTDGKGAIVRDSAGREYIDGNSSIWTNIHGHRHPRIDAAIRKQLDRVAHVSFLGTTNEPATILADRLTGLFPGCPLGRVFYSDDGSTAVEVAVKMSVQYRQLRGEARRTRFLAFQNAYHGDTAGAASLGGLGVFTERFAAIHFPTERAADITDLESLPFDPSEVNAVIIEPLVQGAAGIRLWPAGMLRELRSWCDRHGVLLILDEVLTAFGRTGRMFACEHEGVIPDLLCLAKGLTAGYLPLAATLAKDEIFEAFLGEYRELKAFFYGHSYCGNALGCAAALANLEVFEEEETLAVLQPKIAHLASRLADLSVHACVAATRQCGFIAAIDIQASSGDALDWREQTGARICLAARRHGLLTRPILDTIVLIPPLCISIAEIDRAIEALRLAMTEVAGPGV